MAALGPPPVAEIFAEMAEGPREEGAGPGQVGGGNEGGVWGLLRGGLRGGNGGL